MSSVTILITIKLARNSSHDPQNKQKGPCPINPNSLCSDVTGQHHTFILKTTTERLVDQIEQLTKTYHITRIEQV